LNPAGDAKGGRQVSDDVLRMGESRVEKQIKQILPKSFFPKKQVDAKDLDPKTNKSENLFEKLFL
jgi:hypothetical protein